MHPTRGKVREEIGRGGFAVVYRARDTDLDRVVALSPLGDALVGGVSRQRNRVLENPPTIIHNAAEPQMTGVCFVQFVA